MEKHLHTCELLSESKPEYDARRLQSLALNPAMMFLLADMVEKANNEKTTKLFVEALNGKMEYFDMYVKNLEKSDKIIEVGKRAGGRKRKFTDIEFEEEFVENMENETTDEKLSKLLDYFEGVPLLNITKTVKVFDNKILAVAHTKLDDDDKKWKRLEFSKKKVGKSVSKNFTKDDATEMVGKDVHTCRVAKIFPLKDLNQP